MPAKPIKHGIKVWCLCCSETGYQHSFDVYTGASTTEDGSVVGIVRRLFENANFEGTAAGRVLYTDNFYTSLALMQFVWLSYSMFLVGTYRVSKKKSRTGDDFPFHKISPAALKHKPRGWMRRAVRKFGSNFGNMTAQALVWKDKKQVAILSNWLVQPATAADSVLRYVKGATQKAVVLAHAVVLDYIQHMGAVDRCDRDTADWGIHCHTHRWYMCVVFWLFSKAMCNMFLIAKYHCDNGNENWQWMRKRTRQQFQCAVAQAIATCALEMEWGSTEAERAARPKPSWMRQQATLPCACGTCFFCKQGITNGVTHWGGHARTAAVSTAAASAVAETKKRKRSRKEEVDRNHAKHKKPKALVPKADACQICYHTSTAASWKQRKKQAVRTRQGCVGCGNVLVCEECWPTYEHDFRHLKAARRHGRAACAATAATPVREPAALALAPATVVRPPGRMLDMSASDPHNTRVKLSGKSDYCRGCYAALSGTGLAGQEKRKQCKQTSWGCADCGPKGARVCLLCWPTWSHKLS